jgi:hypothetical protein
MRKHQHYEQKEADRCKTHRDRLYVAPVLLKILIIL